MYLENNNLSKFFCFQSEKYMYKQKHQNNVQDDFDKDCVNMCAISKSI